MFGYATVSGWEWWTRPHGMADEKGKEAASTVFAIAWGKPIALNPQAQLTFGGKVRKVKLNLMKSKSLCKLECMLNGP